MTTKTKKPDLISMEDAAAQGIERLRKPIWANPLDHVKIDIIGGSLGIWFHLYCPFNKECNGRDPVSMLLMQMPDGTSSIKEFVPYTGPLPDSKEYLADVEKYKGCLHGS